MGIFARITVGLKGEWRRVPNLRPAVTLNKEGKYDIILPFDNKKFPNNETLFWLGMGFAEKSELGGYLKDAEAETGVPVVQQTGASSAALRRERRIMERALDFVGGEVAKNAADDSRAFQVFAKAKKDGYLDEAILVNLLNKDLAADYVAYRQKNPERLIRYIKTMLAVLPASWDATR